MACAVIAAAIAFALTKRSRQRAAAVAPQAEVAATEMATMPAGDFPVYAQPDPRIEPSVEALPSLGAPPPVDYGSYISNDNAADPHDFH